MIKTPSTYSTLSNGIIQRSSSAFTKSIIIPGFCKEIQDAIIVARNNNFLIPNDYQLRCLNTFISDMKQSGIWNKKDILYMCSFGYMNTEAARTTLISGSIKTKQTLDGFARINLINPYRHLGTLVRTSQTSLPIFSKAGFTLGLDVNTGANNGYVYTNWIAETNGINWQQNSACVSIYTRNTDTSIQLLVGSVNTVAGRRMFYFEPLATGATTTVVGVNVNNTATATAIANTIGSGFFVIDRSASNLTTLYINGNSIGTTTKASVSMTSNQPAMIYGNVSDGVYGSPNNTQSMGYISYGGSLGSTLQRTEYQIFKQYAEKLNIF